MKTRVLFSLTLILIATMLQATVRTVSNNPATIAQYNNIQSAVNASSSEGDTVLVHGSPFTYASFTITNKQLVVIGPGWAPSGSNPYRADVFSVTISGASSSGTELQGFLFHDGVNVASSHPDNLRFIRNYFYDPSQDIAVNMSQGSTTYSGYTFQGNLFYNTYLNGTNSSTYQNFLVENNLFYCSSSYQYHFSQFQVTSNFIINHNLFYGPSSGSVAMFQSTNNNAFIISNNIMVRRNANCSVSAFNDNITYNCGDNTPWNSNSNTDAGGNVANMNPMMANQALIDAGTFTVVTDFTISSGPADGTGSDGEDMGLLHQSSGSLNWANSMNSRIPMITVMSVTNPVVGAGGTVMINVEARRNN